MPGMLLFISCLISYHLTALSHFCCLFGLWSSPSPLNFSGADIFGRFDLRFGSAMMAVSGSGGGGGGSPALTGSCLPPGLSGLSGVSGNTPGVVRSLQA